MTVLIVEDDSAKAGALATVLENAGFPDSAIVIVPDSQQAKRHLVGSLDLLVLDMQIPKRFDKKADQAGGLDLLRWVARHRDTVCVRHVVAISAFELDLPMQDALADHGVPYIQYELHNIRWQRFLAAFAGRASRCVPEKPRRSEAQFVILTSVDVEFEAALRVFGCGPHAQVTGGESWFVGSVHTESSVVPVIVGQTAQMGMPAAATLTAKAIQEWAPKAVIMTGVCAGLGKDLTHGDIVVADPAWDYGSGKMTSQGLLKPDPRPIPLHKRVRTLIHSLRRSPELREWYDAWPANAPRGIPQVHVGPAASGAAVVESTELTAAVRDQSRKVLAIDMETYGVYFAASNYPTQEIQFASIKSVVDFADNRKGDEYQKFGATMSCRFAYRLIQEWESQNHNSGGRVDEVSQFG